MSSAKLVTIFFSSAAWIHLRALRSNSPDIITGTDRIVGNASLPGGGHAICRRSTASKSELLAEERPNCCTDIERYIQKLRSKLLFGWSSVVFGNASGELCHADSRGIRYGKALRWYSSSKWVFTYVMLKLVDLGKLTLETRPADIFDWWTDDSSDVRSKVTLRHLLAQTDGMEGHGSIAVLGCFKDTLACTKHAYNKAFKKQRTPGTKWKYTETSFTVASGMALAVTGLTEINDLFRTYLADPIGLSKDCRYDFPTKAKAWAGAGLNCPIDDFAKFLMRVQARTIVSEKLHTEAETPYTLNVTNWHPEKLADFEKFVWLPNVHWHYALGAWAECNEPDCSGGVARLTCAGAGGATPWVNREKNTSGHWGLITRAKLPLGMSQMRRPYQKIMAKVYAYFDDVKTATKLQTAFHFSKEG